MIDDLEDKSLKRRGQPCSYIKYGDDVAVNTGTLMYYAPITKVNHYIKNPQTVQDFHQIYSEEMMNIHFGQNWDIHWHNGKCMPTEK
jgi:geranylgeranyl pyrophosphate synthase